MVWLNDDLNTWPEIGPVFRLVRTRTTQGETTTETLWCEVAQHLVSAGGKRLRPALTLCAAYAAEGAETASAART